MKVKSGMETKEQLRSVAVIARRKAGLGAMPTEGSHSQVSDTVTIVSQVDDRVSEILCIFVDEFEDISELDPKQGDKRIASELVD